VEIYTIGHSNLELSRFLEILRQHRIVRLIDVRSYPYSKRVVWANASPLAAALRSAGIAYASAGDALGGRPSDPRLRSPTGRPDYDRIAASDDYQRGIERLLAVAGRERAAILCSEGDPMMCHRERLIGRTLRQRGCAVRHILRDGSILAQHQPTLC